MTERGNGERGREKEKETDRDRQTDRQGSCLVVSSRATEQLESPGPQKVYDQWTVGNATSAGIHGGRGKASCPLSASVSVAARKQLNSMALRTSLASRKLILSEPFDIFNCSWTLAPTRVWADVASAGIQPRSTVTDLVNIQKRAVQSCSYSFRVAHDQKAENSIIVVVVTLGSS